MSSRVQGDGVLRRAGAGHPLDPVLRPRSVVVVGASSDPGKRGHQVIPALREAGYAGSIHLVNPRGGEMLGLPVYRSVAELPGPADVALVCTPAPTVPGILEECAACGVRGAVVLATGFKEAGEDGAELERRIREVARRTGLRIVGPNTSGILDATSGLNLIGLREVRPGPLALLLQSGNVALALVTEVAARRGPGISFCIGLGNETDVGFHECLDFLGEDPTTGAVLVYADGFREPRSFLETAARVSRRKPVAVLKAGRTGPGAAAARSHTGAVSGEYAVLRAGLAQAGVVEVRRTDELLPVGETLATQPPVDPDRGVVLLSDGGGHGALAADSMGEAGVRLAGLSPGTRKGLRELLGPANAVDNPVDVGGVADADPFVFARALGMLAADPDVGGVLVIGLFGGYHLRFAPGLETAETRAAAAMAAAMRAAGKPLVVHSLYASRESAPLRILREEKVPVVESLEVACRCMAAAVERGRLLSRPSWPPPASRVRRRRGATVLRSVRAARRTALTEPEARSLLASFGVPLAPAEFCRSPEEAARAAGRFGGGGGQVVLKAVAPGLLHKTEAGAVLLGVRGAEEARVGFETVRRNALAWLRERGAPGEPEGVLVLPDLPPPLAELLVGARRDPGLGPVLAVGAGGTAVELLGDVVHRVLPVAAEEVPAMLRELRTAELLLGHRGRPPADLGALVRTVFGVAECLLASPEVEEVEANPVFAYPDGAVAVDARVCLARSGLEEGGE